MDENDIITICNILNEALEADPEAIKELMFEKRVVCNKELAEHPTIQVGLFYKGTNKMPSSSDYNMEDMECKVGLLGLLNGITQYYGYVLCAITEKNPNPKIKATNCGDPGMIIEFKPKKLEV